MDSFFSHDELQKIGFKDIGENVLLSRKASIYGASNISIGNNVRIDDFSILSGKIIIGNNVHISAGVYLFAGEAGIVFDDFSGISSKSIIYAESDDYSGEYMTNSMVVQEARNVISEKVYIGKYVQIGASCTVLPGVNIPEGCAIGCMSLINRSLESWNMYIGVPCKILKPRSKKILDLEEKYYR